jgi:hypothetical protein
MKSSTCLFIFGILLWSCSGGGDDPVSPPAQNNAPATPTQVYPTNNLLCIDNGINFQWNVSIDPDGDTITYIFEVATNNQFSPLEHSSALTGTYKDLTLEKGIRYYWRIKARDSKNLDSSYSSVYSFYTEGNGILNHLPFSPELIAPELNSILQSDTATLNWNASDVDTDDTLTYDVFFGTVNPPTTKISGNQSATTLDVTLSSSTDYYWKVEVKDDKGGEAIGQIWNFKK